MNIANDPFAFLPDETVLDIALHEPIRNITELCQSSSRFNNLICNNNSFWRELLLQIKLLSRELD